MASARESLASTASFEEFSERALAEGFDEAISRTWQPNQVAGDHAHPFDAEALVVDGEMWLTDAKETRHLKPGDTFLLEQGTVHAETYGAAGATYWVARRASGNKAAASP